MIASRLRSEARSGSTNVSSTRFNSQNGSFYGNKLHHPNTNDVELKRALQRSYTSQTVRKWEKRWVTINETSMRVHKWMPIANSNRITKVSSSNTTKSLESIPSTQILIEDENPNGN